MFCLHISFAYFYTVNVITELLVVLFFSLCALAPHLSLTTPFYPSTREVITELTEFILRALGIFMNSVKMNHLSLCLCLFVHHRSSPPPAPSCPPYRSNLVLVHSPSQGILSVMNDRLDRASEKGCDGVGPDAVEVRNGERMADA